MDIYKTSLSEVECPRCGNTYRASKLKIPAKTGIKATVVCEACNYQFEVIVKIESKKRRVRKWFFFWRTITEQGKPMYSICFRPAQKNLFEGEE